MSNLTKPPILDETGQDILTALGAIKQNLPQGGGSNGYTPTDATENTLADDDKVPFYDTSASGKRNSTWANIKAKLKAYFDTIYGSVTGVKGDSESTYRTGNVNITSDNIGALSKNGGTISGNILPDNNYSHGLGNYGHAFGAVSSATYYVDDSVNGGRSKVYFEGTGLLNSVKIPEGNGTMATEAYVAKLRVEKTLAEFNALTPAEQDDPEIVYYIPDKPSLGYPVQDDGTATDLTDGALATGRTLESFLNSCFGGLKWKVHKNRTINFTNGLSTIVTTDLLPSGVLASKAMFAYTVLQGNYCITTFNSDKSRVAITLPLNQTLTANYVGNIIIGYEP